jgi:Fic family protein
MNELNSLIGFRISYTIKENLSKYYKAFKICNDPKNKGDISPFVHFFLDIILESENNLYSALKDRQEKLEYYDRIIDRFTEEIDSSTIFLYRLLTKAALFSNYGISMHELENNMEESPNTIRKRLRQIPEKALIRKIVGRTNYYSLDLDEIENLNLGTL